MRFGRFHHRRSRQAGYILITIMFLMVLLVIAMLATAPAIKTQIQRDREEEMIHRGAQYSRAIKRYFKKFGRYPGTLEQLEKTNDIRFLRKQYKDPMVADGKWRLLHFGDVKIGAASNIGTPVSAMGTMSGPSGSLGQPAGQTPSAFGGSPSGFGPSGQTASAFGGGQSGFGPSGQTPSAFGGGQSGFGPSGSSGMTNQPSTSPGGLSSQPSTSGSSSMTSSTAAIGAGAIVGVASLSEKEGLHVFNEKTHYNEWYFVFDQTIDAGGLIRGPYSGKTFAAGGNVVGNAPGMGAQGQPSGSFGQPSSGQPSSFTPPAPLGQPSSFGQPQQQPPNPR